MTPSFLTLFFLTLLMVNLGVAHDGPDPVAHWIFDSRHISDENITAQVGPNAKLVGRARIVKDELGESLAFRNRVRCGVDDLKQVTKTLPKNAMTISTWIAIDEPETWGGIVGSFQDNGDFEKGWVLGYDNSVFSFGLATSGSDDGNGKMTYLKGSTKWEKGKLFHVVAVFDGKTTELYVNGKLDASTDEQSGTILYPDSTPIVIGAYRDSNEQIPMRGRIRDIKIFDEAAKAKWVAHEFEHDQRLVELEAQISAVANSKSFVIAPYLQFGTQTGMTVMWRTAQPASATVWYGETAQCDQNLLVKT